MQGKDGSPSLIADATMGHEKVFVVCCLTGGWPGASRDVNARCADVGAHYVRTLAALVEKFAPRDQPWEFICFTDRPQIEGVTCRPIPKLWSFFAKLYLFNTALFPTNSRVLYLDLDTCIVRSWAPLARIPLEKMVLLRDVWFPTNNASGLMSWRVTSATARIWSEFESQSLGRPPYTPTTPRLGITTDIRTDEQWLHHYTQPNDWVAFQDLLPGQLVSYKHHVLGLGARGQQDSPKLTPEQQKAIRVVYFHGMPRPHEVRQPWNPFYV